jgi:predicted alpha/beta superfamily hydrolase
MKQLLLFLASVLLFFPSAAQPGNQLVLGKTDSIHSSVLQEKRRFYVHVPTSAAGKEAATKRYPVMYLFDADAQFAAATSLMQYLSTNYNTICPEMIVVGILHSDRRKDLTPTHVRADPPFLAAGAGKTSGGGESFIAFMEQELIPYIDKHYPTQPYKTLIGHSLGGLAVMQIFVHHTHLFNSYICIDPSMWWDKQTLLKETKLALEKRNFNGTTLYLGIANTADKDMDINRVLIDTTKETLHVRSGLTLQRYFESNQQNGLKYQGKYYQDDSHMSVPFITEYEALHFIFRDGLK